MFAECIHSLQCALPMCAITLSVFMLKRVLLLQALNPSHSNICSFNEAALTNTPPSTCRCFWGSQEAEAGNILFQKPLGPASDEEGTVVQ